MKNAFSFTRRGFNHIFGHILGDKNLKVQLTDHEKTLDEKAVHKSWADQNPERKKVGAGRTKRI